MGLVRSLRRSQRRLCVLALALICATVTYVLVVHKALHANIKSRFVDLPVQFISTDAGQACVQPKLALYPDTRFRRFFWNVAKPVCTSDTDWIYVENGTIRFSASALNRHGYITCDYIPLIREDEFNTVEGTRVRAIQDGTKLTSDFFKAACFAKSAQHYENYHAGIVPVRDEPAQMAKKALDLNVLIWGFDSVSRLTWMRKLPKTYDFLVRKLQAVVLEGYNIVGDGTPQALLPILCGKTETELPEARRGQAGATTVDGHPWIWKLFKKAGYATQWVEDGVRYGTFTYRMLGFKDQPVDHYMRTFYLEADKTYWKYKPYCLGSQLRHNIMLNWLRDLFHAYPNKRKFSFGFHAECSHEDNNPLSMVDEDVVNFLRYMHDSGYLNDTLLIVMSDHGARFHDLRETVQGKYEERNPFFSVRLPPWFADKYPALAGNLRQNAKRLTTPFDIHETLKDVLDYRSASVGNVSSRGISLFSQIPRERTCTHASIDPHWCTCLTWRQVDPTLPVVQRAAGYFVFHVNHLTKLSTELCQPLTLEAVTRAATFTPNANLLKFKKSSDNDGRVPDLSGTTHPDVTLYQLSLRTQPGNGHFEVTIKHSLSDDRIVISEREISRVNAYGDSPACVAHIYPHLRPYCVCK